MPVKKIHSHIPTVTRRVHPAVTVAAALLGFAATLAAIVLVRGHGTTQVMADHPRASL